MPSDGGARMTPQSLIVPAIIVLVMAVIVVLCVRRLRTLQHSIHGKARRITEWVLLSFVILICVFLGGTTGYNAAALRYYHAIYPPPGKIYRVNGYDMHLYCTGEGSPTLILEAGGGNDSLTWTKVQPELSKTTQVCSYDRAGFGWSRPQPPPRDADSIARDLHALLQEASVQGPIVLMGHSRAGLYVRAYNRLYPEQVKGLILIDTSTPLAEERMSPELRVASPFSAGAYSKRLYYSLVSLNTLGLLRVMGACSPNPAFDEPTGKRIAQLECGKSASPIWEELEATRQSGEETINTGPYGALPVLIFSRDPEMDRQDSGLSPQLLAEEIAFWNQEQEKLKLLSTHSRRIIAKGSSHSIQYDRADLLNREVADFILQIRNNEQRTDYGSTITE